MSIEEITEVEFADHKETLCLIKFGAPWCAPCKKIDPVLDEVAGEIDFPIWKVNVDKSPQMAMQFDVMSVPTMYLLVNGDIKGVKNGVMTKEEILKWIEEVKGQ